MKITLERGDFVEMKDNGKSFGAELVELKSYKGNGKWKVVSEDGEEGTIKTKNIYEARGSGRSVVDL